MIPFHSLHVAPKQDYFHSFPFLYFKTTNQGYLGSVWEFIKGWNRMIIKGMEWNRMEWNGFSRERNRMEWNLKSCLDVIK